MPVLKVKKNGTWEPVGVPTNIPTIINGTITLVQGDWYLGDDGLYHNDENDGTCPGVTADATVIVTPDPSNADSFNWYIECGIRCVSQGEETLFFVADTDPNEYDDIVVNYTVLA